MTSRDLLQSRVVGVARGQELKMFRNLTFTELSLIKLELVSDLISLGK